MINLAVAGTFLTTYPAVLAALITFVLTVSVQLVRGVFAPRPRLIWGVTNNNLFVVPFVPLATEEVPNPPQQISSYYARNIWLQNVGSAVAEDVEVVWNWKPQHLERYPHFPATEHTQGDNRYVMTFARLNPREGVNFGMLSLNAQHPDVTLLRCKGFSARQVPFSNQRRYANWVLLLVAGDMLLGLFAVIYLLVLLALWVF